MRVFQPRTRPIGTNDIMSHIYIYMKVVLVIFVVALSEFVLMMCIVAVVVLCCWLGISFGVFIFHVFVNLTR